MAKIYETEADREKEQIITEIFCKHMNVNYSKSSVRARYDFAIVTKMEYNNHIFDVVTGLAEVKVRTCSIDDYPTYMVDVDKRLYMTERCNQHRTPYLIVAWKDAIGWIDFRSKSFLSTGGRTDRNNPYDQKLMVHYPIKDFTLLVDNR